MIKVILILFFSCVAYGQDSTHVLFGKWLESDPIYTDSTFFLDFEQLYFNNWEFELFSDSTYIENKNNFCNGENYSSRGRWVYSDNKLLLDENLICTNSSKMSYTFDIIWLSSTMWYECEQVGEYYIIYVYKKVENF